jgi:chromate transport protein ChrA
MTAMPGTRGPGGPFLIGILGLVLLVIPSSALGFVSQEVWEIEMFRFVALAAAAVACLWTWAMGRGILPATRMRRWTAVAAITLAIYLSTGHSMFLIASFCALIGALLDLGAGRVDQVSRRVFFRAYRAARHRQSD